MEVTTAAGTATSYGILKFILGHTVAAAVATALGFLLVQPRSPREAMVRIFSTLFSSFIFGPIAVAYIHLNYPGIFESAAAAAASEGMVGLGEMYVSWPIVVLCGLPAWWIMGWVMRWFDNRKDKDFGQVVSEASVIMKIFRSGATDAAVASLTEAAAQSMIDKSREATITTVAVSTTTEQKVAP